MSDNVGKSNGVEKITPKNIKEELMNFINDTNNKNNKELLREQYAKLTESLLKYPISENSEDSVAKGFDRKDYSIMNNIPINYQNEHLNSIINEELGDKEKYINDLKCILQARKECWTYLNYKDDEITGKLINQFTRAIKDDDQERCTIIMYEAELLSKDRQQIKTDFISKIEKNEEIKNKLSEELKNKLSEMREMDIQEQSKEDQGLTNVKQQSSEQTQNIKGDKQNTPPASPEIRQNGNDEHLQASIIDGVDNSVDAKKSQELQEENERLKKQVMNQFAQLEIFVNQQQREADSYKLFNEIDSIKNKINELKETVENRKISSKEFNKSFESLNSYFVNLSNQLTSVFAMVSDENKTLSKTNKINAQLNGDLYKQLQIQNEQLANLQNQLKTAQEANTAQRDQINTQQQQLQDARTTIAKQAQKLETEQKRRAQAEAGEQQLQNDNRNLSQQLRQAQGAKKTADLEFNRLSGENQQLKKENETLRKGNDDRSKQLNSKVVELEQMKADKSQTEAENLQLNDENKILRRQLQEQVVLYQQKGQQLQEQEKRLETQKQQLEEKQKQIDNLQTQLDASNKQINDLNDKIENINTEKVQLTDKGEELKSQIDKLTATIEDKEEIINNKNEQIKQNQADIDGLKADNENKNEQLTSKQEEIARQKEEFARLQEELVKNQQLQKDEAKKYNQLFEEKTVLEENQRQLQQQLVEQEAQNQQQLQEQLVMYQQKEKQLQETQANLAITNAVMNFSKENKQTDKVVKDLVDVIGKNIDNCSFNTFTSCLNKLEGKTQLEGRFNQIIRKLNVPSKVADINILRSNKIKAIKEFNKKLQESIQKKKEQKQSQSEAQKNLEDKFIKANGQIEEAVIKYCKYCENPDQNQEQENLKAEEQLITSIQENINDCGSEKLQPALETLKNISGLRQNQYDRLIEGLNGITIKETDSQEKARVELKKETIKEVVLSLGNTQKAEQLRREQEQHRQLQDQLESQKNEYQQQIEDLKKENQQQIEVVRAETEQQAQKAQKDAEQKHQKEIDGKNAEITQLRKQVEQKEQDSILGSFFENINEIQEQAEKQYLQERLEQLKTQKIQEYNELLFSKATLKDQLRDQQHEIAARDAENAQLREQVKQLQQERDKNEAANAAKTITLKVGNDQFPTELSDVKLDGKELSGEKLATSFKEIFGKDKPVEVADIFKKANEYVEKDDENGLKTLYGILNGLPSNNNNLGEAIKNNSDALKGLKLFSENLIKKSKDLNKDFYSDFSKVALIKFSEVGKIQEIIKGAETLSREFEQTKTIENTIQTEENVQTVENGAQIENVTLSNSESVNDEVNISELKVEAVKMQRRENIVGKDGESEEKQPEQPTPSTNKVVLDVKIPQTFSVEKSKQQDSTAQEPNNLKQTLKRAFGKEQINNPIEKSEAFVYYKCIQEKEGKKEDIGLKTELGKGDVEGVTFPIELQIESQKATLGEVVAYAKSVLESFNQEVNSDNIMKMLDLQGQGIREEQLKKAKESIANEIKRFASEEKGLTKEQLKKEADTNDNYKEVLKSVEAKASKLIEMKNSGKINETAQNIGDNVKGLLSTANQLARPTAAKPKRKEIAR